MEQSVVVDQVILVFLIEWLISYNVLNYWSNHNFLFNTLFCFQEQLKSLHAVEERVTGYKVNMDELDVLSQVPTIDES